MKQKIFKILILLFLFFPFNNFCSASDYYSSPDGSGSLCSPESPCSISEGWNKVSSGDTLILKDGQYVNVSPPSGKSGLQDNNIVIKAENDGSAIISGGLVLSNNSYLTFEGLKIVSSGYSLDAHSAGAGLVTHHVTFKRTGFNTTTTAENGGVLLFDGTHDMLFEDFWVWGGGRYSVQLYGGNGGNPPNLTADNNVFRRGVIRQGPANSSPGNPEAGISFYYSSNNLIENVIVLDGKQDSNSSNAAFYLTAHAPVTGAVGSNNNTFLGNIALNNLGSGFYLDVDNGGQGNNIQIKNSVAWHNSSGIQLYVSHGATGAIIDHCTLGATNNSDAFFNYIQGTTITNTVAMNSSAYGIAQSGPGSFLQQNHNNTYSNSSGNYRNTVAGAGSITSNPNLLYLIRIENSSLNKNVGTTGDIGANILFKYENGVETQEKLWPWAYENRIRKDMCDDAGVVTGFCSSLSLDGSAQTLTKYIWEYLGNIIPSEIYGLDIFAPSSPSGLMVE